MIYNPSQFIMEVIPGGLHFQPGTRIEFNEDNINDMSLEQFENVVSKHYEYTKIRTGDSVIFTLIKRNVD
jgi:hypothetical protein